METRAQSRASLCGICGTQSGSTRGYFRFSLVSILLPKLHTHSFIERRCYIILAHDSFVAHVKNHKQTIHSGHFECRSTHFDERHHPSDDENEKSAEEVVVAEGERLDLRQRDRTLGKLHDKISV